MDRNVADVSMTLLEILTQYEAMLPEGANLILTGEGVRNLLAMASDTAPKPEQRPIADLTVAQAAAIIGRKPSTVRGWLASGAIPEAYPFRGREWRIPPDAFTRFLANQRTPKANERPAPSRNVDISAWRDIAA